MAAEHGLDPSQGREAREARLAPDNELSSQAATMEGDSDFRKLSKLIREASRAQADFV